MRPEDCELLARVRGSLPAVRGALLEEMGRHALPPAAKGAARVRIIRKLTHTHRENETHGLRSYALRCLRADDARRFLILYFSAEHEAWVPERLREVARSFAGDDRRWALDTLRRIEDIRRKMEHAATPERGEQLFAQRFAYMEHAAHRLDRLFRARVQSRAA